MMPPPPAAEEWSVVPVRKYSSFHFSITSRQALETVVGSTQASRVIPELSCRDLLFGIVTRLLVPLKESALPYFPAVVQVALAIVPVLPLPDVSVTVVPEPSSKPYAATSPDGAAGVLTVATLLYGPRLPTSSTARTW